jgi:hypothetical protein
MVAETDLGPLAVGSVFIFGSGGPVAYKGQRAADQEIDAGAENTSERVRF